MTAKIDPNDPDARELIKLLARRQQEQREELYKTDFAAFASGRLKVLNKVGKMVPLQLNRAQLYVHEKLEEQKRLTGGKVRALIPKARRLGVSTYVGARFYHRSVYETGLSTMIFTHLQSSTDKLFDMVELFHRNDPQAPEIGAHSAKELVFKDRQCSYQVATAGEKNVGVGQTLQNFHASEMSVWDNAAGHMAGIGQAVADLPGTEIIMESTGRGIGNVFYDMCMQAMSGLSDYILIFLPWFWDTDHARAVPDGFERTAQEEKLAAEYGLTNEQLAWRRAKIATDFRGDESWFKREFPATVMEAFQSDEEQSLIPASLAQEAAKRKHERKGPLRLGVDPSGSENPTTKNDPAGLVLRDDGGVIFSRSLVGTTSMSLVGEVLATVKQYKDDAPPGRPDLAGIRGVFVDVIGAGAGVVGRLRELPETAHIVRSVDVRHTAFDEERCKNVRTELYVRVKDWLPSGSITTGGNGLMVQLASLHYERNSKGQLILESKDDARGRGVRSPNESDALALTFAETTAFDAKAGGWVPWATEKTPKCVSIIRSAYFEFEEHGGAWAVTTWGIFKPADKDLSAILLNVEEGAGTLSQFTAAEKKVWFLDKKEKNAAVMKNDLPDFLLAPRGGKRDAVFRHIRREHILCKRIRYDDVTGPQVFGETIAAGRVYLPERQWAQRLRSDVARYPAGERVMVVHSVAMALLWLRWMGQVTPEEEDKDAAPTRPVRPIYG